MTKSHPDHTAAAVSRALDALPHPSYEVGIFDMGTERMYLRRWDRATVERSVGYLKQQNFQGKHIYIRPAGPHPYTMLDDINVDTVQRLTDAGYGPALVVETSPGNLQAWLKHPRELPPELSTHVAKRLAADFGGDPSSADWRHFGRLPGFINRKEAYKQPNGHYPFVRVIAATGHAHVAGNALVDALEADLARLKAEEKQRRETMPAAPAFRTNADRPERSIADFRNAPTYAGDYHRADLAYATYALSRGLSDDQVEAAIRTRDLSHKGGATRQTDYIERTIHKARESVRRGRDRG